MGKAHNDVSKTYENCGKAILPECKKCGFWMQAVPKHNGNTWVCGNIDCKHTEFEVVKK